MWNSIAQVLLKIASPGVPDFYQGNEIWAFDLVDPDNRRAVNYEVRRQMLASLRAQAARNRPALVERLRENLCDGAIKMFITSEALRFRREHAELFSQGSYAGLAAEGGRARHVVAFARARENQMMLAVTGRFFLKLCNSHGKPIGDVWGNTTVALPKKVKHESFQNVFTGQTIAARRSDGRLSLPLNEVFSQCPVALLFAESGI
jgi:(1->4)-alpha-D-glucan 1-alpha-D-glucosylmutase